MKMTESQTRHLILKFIDLYLRRLYKYNEAESMQAIEYVIGLELYQVNISFNHMMKYGPDYQSIITICDNIVALTNKTPKPQKA